MSKSPTILAIETSSDVCSLALMQEGEFVLETNIFKFNSHDELLAELINNTLNLFKLTIESIDAIAISSGPGSYTGLRIGTALVKGMIINTKTKLIGVPTLDAFALEAKSYVSNYQSICVLLNNFKDLTYRRYYDVEGKPISEVENISSSDLLYDNKVLYVGNKVLSNDVKQVSHSARLILNKAKEKYEASEFENIIDFLPNYITDFIPTNTKL